MDRAVNNASLSVCTFMNAFMRYRHHRSEGRTNEWIITGHFIYILEYYYTKEKRSRTEQHDGRTDSPYHTEMRDPHKKKRNTIKDLESFIGEWKNRRSTKNREK